MLWRHSKGEEGEKYIIPEKIENFKYIYAYYPIPFLGLFFPPSPFIYLLDWRHNMTLCIASNLYLFTPFCYNQYWAYKAQWFGRHKTDNKTGKMEMAETHFKELYQSIIKKESLASWKRVD